jgi:hypothetical protein
MHTYIHALHTLHTLHYMALHLHLHFTCYIYIYFYIYITFTFTFAFTLILTFTFTLTLHYITYIHICTYMTDPCLCFLVFIAVRSCLFASFPWSFRASPKKAPPS